MNKFHVIVVDDDNDAAKTFAELIEARLKIPVHPESNPDTVLQIVKMQEIKVVVLDQRMPNMTGTELYRQILEINPHIVALMLTGEADRKEVAYAMGGLKYFDYIEKNDIQTLPNKVISALSFYEKRIADQQSTSIPLCRLNIFRNRLFTRQYEIVSIEIIDNNFIFENKWEVKHELLASEQEIEDFYEYEEDLIIGEEFEIKSNATSAIASKIIPTIKTEINSALVKKFGTTNKKHTKKNNRNKRVYKLQEGVPEGTKVIKKVFEYTPVYVHYRIIVKKRCRLCGMIEIYPLDVYKRIPSVATRVKIFYSNQEKQIIYTDNISI